MRRCSAPTRRRRRRTGLTSAVDSNAPPTSRSRRTSTRWRQAAAHRAKFLQAFGAVDLIVSLVGATGPTTTADPDVVHLDGTTVPLRDAVMPYTVPQNVAGLPSITVPVAFDADGLPIGVQLTGRPWSEPLLISVAVELQRCGAARSHTVPSSPREG